MGRVGRLMERRVLRRAADQALLTGMFAQPAGVASAEESSASLGSVRESWDFEHLWGDLDDRDPKDHEELTEPIPVGEIREHLLDQTPGDRRPGFPTIGDWLADYRPRPWYRNKPAAIGVGAAAVAAVTVLGVLFVLRSPAPPAEQSTSVAPQATTPVRPTPTTPRSVPPIQASVPLPSPAPPPPPSATQINPAPGATRQSPSPAAGSSQTPKPEIGVTRAPVTRAPISVAPEPRPAPGNNSSAPGDGPSKDRGGWGWGW